ncbi:MULTISPECIES: DUF3905 domain-containing protein [Brevibacillus]|uniref:DUF3905 domain-containing protein n=1 Tax=Brevibacillus TaxID=55080 RepID=UPI000E2E7B64|nr:MULTISPECIES: DUF3905 domain-containing protein [Brevibacillus]MBG9789890.1 hypothetical protein [Brevibacillus laterosporus]MCG7320128.1 DUF3905 domain-containing protein [Brevibacillus laterosporus]RFB28259.1 DUF3905 domain-containing protein [Brevibacillus sp. VP]
MKSKPPADRNPLAVDQTMPHQINAPDFKQARISMQAPFVNQYGITIGDSAYDSADSPINNWSRDVDPAIMAGPEWVHPTNDIGWNTSENRELLEKQQLRKKKGMFTHLDKDVSYHTD